MPRPFATAILLASLPVLAEDAGPQARELSTDRPDKTESPFTVPAGRWQAETEAFSFRLDEHGTDAAILRTTGWSVGAVNLKLGLTERFDLQVVLPMWAEQERRFTDGHRERERGWSDLTIRAKVNLFGNDRGSTAMALMPFLSLPTAGGAFGSDAAEGGLIVPFAARLGGWNLGTIIEGRPPRRSPRHLCRHRLGHAFARHHRTPRRIPRMVE